MQFNNYDKTFNQQNVKHELLRIERATRLRIRCSLCPLCLTIFCWCMIIQSLHGDLFSLAADLIAVIGVEIEGNATEWKEEESSRRRRGDGRTTERE